MAVNEAISWVKGSEENQEITIILKSLNCNLPLSILIQKAIFFVRLPSLSFKDSLIHLLSKEMKVDSIVKILISSAYDIIIIMLVSVFIAGLYQNSFKQTALEKIMSYSVCNRKSFHF